MDIADIVTICGTFKHAQNYMLPVSDIAEIVVHSNITNYSSGIWYMDLFKSKLYGTDFVTRVIVLKIIWKQLFNCSLFRDIVQSLGKFFVF